MSGVETRYERLELKYLIDERTANAVRRDLEPFCAPDPHNEDRTHAPDLDGLPGYPISSLYLDSPGLAFHHAKERGDSERLKLRIRSYAGSPFAVLELKRRVSEVVEKTRIAVPRELVRQAVEGAKLAYESAEVATFAERFARVAAESGAQPTLHVRYMREAFSSLVDHYARVTFDRRIEALSAEDWTLAPAGCRWSSFDDHWLPEQRRMNVVLEIKCHAFVPWWVTDLVRRHALKRRSFSKYSVGIHITSRELGFESLARRSARVMR